MADDSPKTMKPAEPPPAPAPEGKGDQAFRLACLRYARIVARSRD